MIDNATSAKVQVGKQMNTCGNCVNFDSKDWSSNKLGRCNAHPLEILIDGSGTCYRVVSAKSDPNKLGCFKFECDVKSEMASNAI